MDGALIGFIIWAIFGGIMVGIGVSAFFLKESSRLLDKCETFSGEGCREIQSCHREIVCSLRSDLYCTGNPVA